jgi:putative transposase
VVTPTQQRAAAKYFGENYDISQRRASRVLGMSRSTLRYRRRQHPGETALIRALRRLARRHPRFGYKRIHFCLVKQGWPVNRKRVRRLLNELRRPACRKKPRNLGSKTGSSANTCVNQPARFKNDVCNYDFVADHTIDGGSLKWLTLLDESPGERLALHMASPMTGADVRRVLLELSVGVVRQGGSVVTMARSLFARRLPDGCRTKARSRSK